MVIPLYFLPMLSSLPTNIRKQLMSQQQLIQGDSNSINNALVSLYALIVWLRSLSPLNSLLST